MTHATLGLLARDGSDWAGAARLPLFAAPGTALRNETDPPAGQVRVRVESAAGALTAEQDAAVARLFADEPQVFAAVWGELQSVLHFLNLQTQVICTEVVVSRSSHDGVAYLGFSIDADCHLEHGLQVVYHPTRGTWWGDWEALNAIDAPPDDADDEA